MTGEHTCMVLKLLANDEIEVKKSDDEWGFFGDYYRAFKAAFARLLCSPRFNTMEYKLAMRYIHTIIQYIFHIEFQ